MNYFIFSSVLLISIFSLQLAFYIYSIRNRVFYRGLLGISISHFIYSLFYLFELITFDIELMKILASFQRIGSLLMAFFYIITALEYTQRAKYINRKFIILMLIIPFFIIMNFTDNYHHLFYKNYETVIQYSLSFAVITPGIGYIINSIYLNIMFLTGIIIYIHYLITNKNDRKRTLIIMLTSFLSWISLIIYISNIIKTNFDLNVIFLFIILVVFVQVILRNKIFYKLKIAKDVAFDNINDIVIVVDNENRIIETNKIAEAFLNKKDTKLINEKIEKFFPNINIFNKHLDELRESKFDFEFYNKYYRCEITFVKRIAKIISLKDITDEQIMIKKLQYYATMDKLTEVYNRNYFHKLANERLNYCLNRNMAFTAVMIDLDLFKNINDTYGHIAGDLVLRNVIKIIRNCLGENSVIFRYGGEEFIIILEDKTESEVFEIIEKIRIDIMNYDNEFEDKNIKVTCSFGIYTTYHERDLETIIRRADDAVYQSKCNGRNKTSIYH